ncbi:hypothetical protein WHR41_01061 [Cladosporium halotolerans]|uniref:Translation initiation factor 3 N-terminal domain-containing protein n=1 Tax=Cladosporium halotolerans TaxID=1052096 RepID=A0AB34L276_9PEZI
MVSKHISHTASPYKALYNVFVQPALSTSRTARPQWLNRNLAATPKQHLSPQTRSFSSSPSKFFVKRKNANKAPQKREQKWNEEIKGKWIILVNPETNRLEEPTPRWGVLQNLDQKTHRLVQVVPDDPADPNSIPVCKIVDKKESYEADKRRKAVQKENKQAAQKENSVKTLELNWAIDGNDLGHRLDKVKEFLAEGRRVEIVLASKKRGRKASPAECQDVLAKIRSVAQSVKGAKEKSFEGKPGGFATLTFHGKVSAAAAAPAPAAPTEPAEPAAAAAAAAAAQ